MLLYINHVNYMYLHARHFVLFLLPFADIIFFFQNKLLKKNLSGTLLVCQKFWIQIRVVLSTSSLQRLSTDDESRR